jgi:hypothetical protein
MPDELAAEKGAGSDAVSTLSNYLAIRVLAGVLLGKASLTEMGSEALWRFLFCGMPRYALLRSISNHPP